MPTSPFLLTRAAASSPITPRATSTPTWGNAINSMRGGARPARDAQGLYPSIPDSPGLYPAAAGGAMDPLRDDGGRRLPLGDPASTGTPGAVFTGFNAPTNVPGLYRSVHSATPPATQVGTGPAPAPSQFTLTSPAPAPAATPGAAAGAGAVTPAGTPAPLPTAPATPLASTLDRSAEALALSSLFAPGGAPTAAATPGSKSAALAASEAFSGLGSTGNLIEGAEGLEHTRLQLAAQRILQGPTNYDGRHPDGLAKQLPLASDAPEVQANKLAYLTKRFGRDVGADPTLSPDGTAPSTGDLAHLAQTITKNTGQPRFVDLGKDAEGRSVQGTVDRSGNFSRIAPSKTGDYPREVAAGNRKLIEVSQGKFTDDTGAPVEWKDPVDRPLTVNEFLMSPALNQNFDGDYGKYREAFTTQSGKVKPAPGAAPATPAATPGAAPAAAPAAAPNVAAKMPAVVNYNHNDVLAEMKKRGLAK